MTRACAACGHRVFVTDTVAWRLWRLGPVCGAAKVRSRRLVLRRALGPVRVRRGRCEGQLALW